MGRDNDEMLILWNQQGWIPGPTETLEELSVRRAASPRIPYGTEVSAADWALSHERLHTLFDFIPEAFTAFYANQGLMPWQGAVSWMDATGVSLIQLRRSLIKGCAFSLYSRTEVLAHEAVHAARGAFREPKWEEIFAYRVSKSQWRRWLGPLVSSPKEVWLFFLALIVGEVVLFWADRLEGFIGLGCLLAMALARRGWRELLLHRAKKNVLSLLVAPEKVEAFLFRLQDAEIELFAKQDRQKIRHYILSQTSARWRLLRAVYIRL